MAELKEALKKWFWGEPGEIKKNVAGSYSTRKKTQTDRLDEAADYQKKLSKPKSDTKKDYIKVQGERKHQ